MAGGGQSVEAGVRRELFASIMGSWPSGVAVVTVTDQDGRAHGLTSSAVSSVSADPPLVLTCVDAGSRTLPILQRRGRFAVNFLLAGRRELALRFASKADDKFDGVVTEEVDGSPVLVDDVIAYACCVTIQEVPAGDHVILVGRIERGAASEADVPLMYFRGAFGAWGEPS